MWPNVRTLAPAANVGTRVRVDAMFVEDPEMTEALTTRDERIKQSEGYYMKWVRLWGWVPEVEEAFRMARGKLDETTTLTKRERFVIVVSSVSKLGDAYCSDRK